MTSPRSPTLHAALERAASLDLPGAGMRFLDRRERATFLSWAEVRHRALGVAAGLREAGVTPGDRICIVLPTEPAFADAFFGTLLAGAVPVPLYPPVRLGRLDEYLARTAAMLQACDARLLVSNARVSRVLGQVLDRVRPPLGLHHIGPLRSTTPIQGHTAEPHHLAMVQFSSGTTVAPKPVGLTHAQVLANARAITDDLLTRFPESEGHRHCGVSWLPLYHDMGLIGCIFPALDHPSHITLLPPEAFLIKPALWLRAISRYGGTICPAPDFAYALCVERIRDEELEGVDLSTWVAALDGAEPIRPATLRAFRDRFAAWGLREEALTPVYGLSEAALAVTFAPLDQAFATIRVDSAALASGRAVEVAQGGLELARLGPPLRGFDIQIRDSDGQPLPEHRVGRLFVRGPSVMHGYLDRTTQPIEDGWLDTGDLGFMHQGELVVTGRAKDVIVLRGRNHAPQDIEQAVDTVDGVRTGCTVAVGHIGEDGEQLFVFVEVRTPEEGQADACLQAIQSATGLRADLLVLLEPGTIPRTSSGKLRRSETLKRHLAGTLTPPDSVTPLRLAGALARSALARWRNR